MDPLKNFQPSAQRVTVLYKLEDGRTARKAWEVTGPEVEVLRSAESFAEAQRQKGRDIVSVRFEPAVG
jgi:hypothetical protein